MSQFMPQPSPENSPRKGVRYYLWGPFEHWRNRDMRARLKAHAQQQEQPTKVVPSLLLQDCVEFVEPVQVDAYELRHQYRDSDIYSLADLQNPDKVVTPTVLDDWLDGSRKGK